MVSCANRRIVQGMTLLAGDADFQPLIEAVGVEGMYVTLLSHPKSTARELIRAADEHLLQSLV
jgi:uncharacterized LabA/DUF88 family protein